MVLGDTEPSARVDLRVNRRAGMGQQRLLGSGSLRVPGPNGAR